METVGVLVLVAIVMTVGAGYLWLLRAGRPRRAATVAQSMASPLATGASRQRDEPVVSPRASRARLTVVRGGRGTFLLEPRKYVIGRSSEAVIKLADPSVSGRHAVLEYGHDGFRLRDLGSANGTRVDGAGLDGEVLLRGGEEIALGDAVIRFERGGR